MHILQIKKMESMSIPTMISMITEATGDDVEMAQVGHKQLEHLWK